MSIFKRSPTPVRLINPLPLRKRIELWVMYNYPILMLLIGACIVITMILVAFLVVGSTESGIYYNHHGGL